MKGENLKEKETIFNEYSQMIQNNKPIKKRYTKKVFKEIEKKWKNTPYSIKDVCLIHQSNSMIFEAEIHVVSQLFRQAKTPLNTNEKKSGRRVIFDKFKKNFHKPAFKQFFEDYYDSIFKDLSITMHATPSLDTFKSSLLQYDFVTILYLAEKSLERAKWIKFIKKNAFQTYTKTLIDLYFFSLEEHVESTLRKQPKLKDQKKDMKSLKKELDNIKHELRIAEKSERKIREERTKLKNEINQLKQANEKLNKQLEKALKEADEELTAFIKENEDQLTKEKLEKEQEIKSLKEKIEDELEFYNEQITLLVNELEYARRQSFNENSENSEMEHEISLDLCGKKVALIGGNHSKKYISKVKEYNGELSFVPVDDYYLIPGAISNSDVVFFLTDVAGHKHFRCIKKESKRNGIPLRYINSRGLATFERELKDYIMAVSSEQLAGNQ
ncbi:DUF2325 domain-containing protein [Lottiidibacillus patelloidae]|nr:DUF2325 domain-containing protein [Lottiidibacillus patelloidae]